MHTPEQWQRTYLGEVIDFLRNGTSVNQCAEQTPYPVTRIETISEGRIDYARTGYLQLPAESYRMVPGDILYSHINSVAHIGKVAIYLGEKALYHGMNLMLLRPSKGKVHPKILFSILSSEIGRRYARRECKPAVNQASLTQGDTCKLSFLLPLLPEQKRISYILDTIDDAIAKTEAVIEKLKQVRAGMLHNLLSYGLDENGQLRDPIAHPEQFKDTPLGRIPRAWDVRQVSDFCDSYAGGTPSRGMLTFFRGDIPWVKSGEVNLETIYTTEESLTQEGFNSSSAKWIPAGTPLIAMYGATAGQVTWLAIRATCNQAVLAIVPFAKQAYSRFVFWSLRRVSPQIVRLATGSGQPNLSKAIIDRANIALPRTVQEQELIAKRIDCLVELQNIEKDDLEKLQSLKSGLQDDLLTGRVRVPETIMEGAAVA